MPLTAALLVFSKRLADLLMKWGSCSNCLWVNISVMRSNSAENQTSCMRLKSVAPVASECHCESRDARVILYRSLSLSLCASSWALIILGSAHDFFFWCVATPTSGPSPMPRCAIPKQSISLLQPLLFIVGNWGKYFRYKLRLERTRQAFAAAITLPQTHWTYKILQDFFFTFCLLIANSPCILFSVLLSICFQKQTKRKTIKK